MKHQKALTNLSKVKDNDLAEMSQTIVSKMTKNADYPNPTPALTVVDAAVKAYTNALIKCDGGTKEDTAVKNEKRLTLEGHLTHLGNYVNLVAEGDLVKLDRSGFPLSKLPEPVGFLPAPEKFIVTDGENPGEVYYEMKPNKRAHGYIFIYALVPAPEKLEDWHAKTSSNAKGWVGGLSSGKKYTFKAAYSSSDADKISVYNFTQPVERFIQ
ncbi:MAG: hypothetical protein WCR55_05360 [Lentisphaerota bacterium]